MFDMTIQPNPSADLFLRSDRSACGSSESSGVAPLRLDKTAPSVTTVAGAKCKDSAGINFSGGNAWQQIGTWSMTLP